MNAAQWNTVINMLLLLALFASLTAWWLIKHGSVNGKIAERARLAALDHRADLIVPDAPRDEDLQHPVIRFLAKLGDRIPFFDAKTRIALQKEMTRGGYRGKHSVSVLLAIKFISGIVGAVMIVLFASHLPLLGTLPSARGVAMLFMFMLGMILPEFVMKFYARRRKAEMASCLPDALDLLVICTNAGNSFPVSVRRVANELSMICPPLSREFGLTADELQLSGETSRALESLGERIDLPAIRALISTLTQSMRYGTPITQALRTLSRTERLAHMVTLEEKAAKLAPKMVLPMMIFILPPIVAISAGPAIIQLIEFIGKK